MNTADEYKSDIFIANLINENAYLLAENAELESRLDAMVKANVSLQKQLDHLLNGSIDDEDNPMCDIDECEHNVLGECDLKTCVYSDEYDTDEYKPRDPTYHVEYVEYYPNGVVKHIQYRKNAY